MTTPTRERVEALLDAADYLLRVLDQGKEFPDLPYKDHATVFYRAAEELRGRLKHVRDLASEKGQGGPDYEKASDEAYRRWYADDSFNHHQHDAWRAGAAYGSASMEHEKNTMATLAEERDTWRLLANARAISITERDEEIERLRKRLSDAYASVVRLDPGRPVPPHGSGPDNI